MAHFGLTATVSTRNVSTSMAYNTGTISSVASIMYRDMIDAGRSFNAKQRTASIVVQITHDPNPHIHRQWAGHLHHP
jgi:phosphomevalonate kinase